MAKYTLKNLIHAIKKNQFAQAETIINSDDFSLNRPSAKLLRCTIENNRLDIFDLLIKNKNINLKAGSNTAIKLCIEHNRADIMSSLLKTSAFNGLSNTAVYNFFKKAAELKHDGITKALVKNHGHKFRFSTALSWAIKHNLEYSAKQILKSNKKTNSLPLDFLKQAIKENASSELLSVLIHSGKFDVQKTFEWAIEAKPFSAKLIEILLSHLDIDPGAHSNFALHEMARYGHVEIVKLLLAHPKVNPADNNNFALRRAVYYQHLEVVKLLLNVVDKGVDPNISNHYCLKAAAEQKNLDMVQLFLPYCSIHRMKLSNILKSDANDLSAEIINYFEHPESYVSAQPTFTKAQKTAFNILEFKKNITKWEKKKEKTLIHDDENAMNDESVIRAKVTFERKVQPTFSDIFLTYTDEESENKELSAIIHIEKKIRESILDAILASNPSPEIIAFIQKNKAELMNATDLILMKQAREQFFNSNSNTHHLAWRGYDANAPYKGRFNNLLTPPKKVRAVFTTNVAKIDDNTLLNTTASLYVRKMVAYYYLLAISSEIILDEDQPFTEDIKKEVISERVANFISELADMRSAHSDEYNGKPDAPSCYPGYLGRATNMGFKHPLTKETISTKRFIEDMLESYIFMNLKQQLEKCGSEHEGQQLLAALTLLSETGWRAQHVFLGQESYDDELLHIRQSAIHALGTQELAIAEVNKALNQANRPHLRSNDEDNNLSEETYVFQYLLDPARGKLSGKFSAEYLRWVKKFIIAEENPISAEESPENITKSEKLWNNPYTSSVTQINNLLIRNQNNPIIALNISKRLSYANAKLTIFDILQNIVKRIPGYQLDTYDMACYTLFTEKLTETVFEHLQQENIEQFSLEWYKGLSEVKLKLLHTDLQEKLSDCSDDDAFAGALAVFEEFTTSHQPHAIKKTPSFTPLFQGTKTPPLSPSKNANTINRSPCKNAGSSLVRKNTNGMPLL